MKPDRFDPVAIFLFCLTLLACTLGAAIMRAVTP
jgi:hypothetical protein